MKRSKLIVGAGVLCFVGMMALWLVSSGDRAIADAERAAVVAKTLTMSVDTPVAIKGTTTSKVTFKETEGLVQRLSAYFNLKSTDASKVKVYLTSPSGTKVLLVDGARSNAVKKDGLEGWFGTDGIQTIESLAAFAGEPVSGAWNLEIQSAVPATLTKWSLTTDVGPNTTMAGMETQDPYPGAGDGCDCRVSSTKEVAGGLMVSLMLLGLVLLRRRS